MTEITAQSLEELVKGFKDGSWPGANWKHSHHLILTACYVLDYDDALDRLRTGIPRYNECQGGKNTADSGYHETLTRFWYEVIRTYIESLPAGLDRVTIVTLVVKEYAPHRDLFRKFYDFDVVSSREARAVWILPVDGLPDAKTLKLAVCSDATPQTK